MNKAHRSWWLWPALLIPVAIAAGGAYVALSETSNTSLAPRTADTTGPRQAAGGSDSSGKAKREREEATGAPSNDDSARCQPIDDTGDPSDGYVPSPDELLPDPEKCPEFYEGRERAGGSAPPVSGVPPIPGYTPDGTPVPPPYTPKPAPEPPAPPGLNPDEFRLGDPSPRTNDPTPGLPPGTQPNY